jgi:hypothetical protein
MLEALRVPNEFGWVEHIVDENVLARLDAWKTEVESELGGLLRDANLSSTELSVGEQARVVFAEQNRTVGQTPYAGALEYNSSYQIFSRSNDRTYLVTIKWCAEMDTKTRSQAFSRVRSGPTADAGSVGSFSSKTDCDSSSGHHRSIPWP